MGVKRDLYGVISDKKMPRKLKIKPYMTVIRPVLLYGYWTVRQREKQILENTAMRMLIKIKDIKKECGHQKGAYFLFRRK